MKKIVIAFITTLISIGSVSAENEDKTYLRLRAYQASPLLTSSAERGFYEEGDMKIQLSTKPSDANGWMLALGLISFGKYDAKSTFSKDDLFYSLASSSQDIALVFDFFGNTSFTFGFGFVEKGKGEITNGSSTIESIDISGYSSFIMFGLEYEIPLNLDFIGLEYTEVLIGYRENNLKYDNFGNSDITLKESLTIKTIQYQFGLGLVF